jgi:hypothetical protein
MSFVYGIPGSGVLWTSPGNLYVEAGRTHEVGVGVRGEC